MTPPTPTIGSRPPVRRYRSATSARLRAVSGAPDSPFVGHDLRPADVDAEDGETSPVLFFRDFFREGLGGGGRALVVEAHAVDQRPVGGEAEQARPRVARLRLAGQRAHLDEAEA